MGEFKNWGKGQHNPKYCMKAFKLNIYILYIYCQTMVAHVFNSNTLEADPGRSLSSWSAWNAG